MSDRRPPTKSELIAGFKSQPARPIMDTVYDPIASLTHDEICFKLYDTGVRFIVVDCFFAKFYPEGRITLSIGSSATDLVMDVHVATGDMNDIIKAGRKAVIKAIEKSGLDD